MNSRLIFFILFSSIIILGLNCKKTSSSCSDTPEPPVFFFQIKKNGVPLGNDTLQNIKLSYIVNGVKDYITDLSEATDYYANMGILDTRTAGVISSTQGIQIFYIEYPNGFSTDTLFLDYPPVSSSTDCSYFLSKVQFDGVTIEGDTAFGYQPVYVFNKP